MFLSRRGDWSALYEVPAMLGLIIAAAYAAYIHFGLHGSWENAYFGALPVLLWAQIALTAGSFIWSLIVIAGLKKGADATAAVFNDEVFAGPFFETHAAAFKQAAFTFSAGALFAAFGIFVISRAILLGGTWLLMQAGTPGMTFAEFDRVALWCGALALMVGIFWTRSFPISASTSTTRRRG